ncbi:hypothetical protein [Rothia aeria]|uniref:hypothetical protein n=1 Tax=Rothia aeria TaxID=172042 RepID=UPI00244B0346|nr:hypothetical protein [Rothia sp. RSM482]
MSLSIMQRSAAEVGIGHFVPKKQESSGLYADARAELEKNPLLFQILANFEAQHRLPDLAGETDAVIIQARISRYLLLGEAQHITDLVFDVTKARTWNELAACGTFQDC